MNALRALGAYAAALFCLAVLGTWIAIGIPMIATGQKHNDTFAIIVGVVFLALTVALVGAGLWLFWRLVSGRKPGRKPC